MYIVDALYVSSFGDGTYHTSQNRIRRSKRIKSKMNKKRLTRLKLNEIWIVSKCSYDINKLR